MIVAPVAFAFPSQINSSGNLIFLLPLLPILNALADMLSLAATRWFLGHVAPPQGPDTAGAKPPASLLRILIQLMLDLVVALLCLALLIGLITSGLDLWGRISPSTLPLNWRAYWAGVQADRATGWALYLMVGTTLLPTAVHVVAGLGAMLTHRSRLTAAVARRLYLAQAEGTTLLDPELNTMVSQIHRATLWGYGIAFGAAVIGFGAVGWSSVAIASLISGAPTP